MNDALDRERRKEGTRKAEEIRNFSDESITFLILLFMPRLTTHAHKKLRKATNRIIGKMRKTKK